MNDPLLHLDPNLLTAQRAVASLQWILPTPPSQRHGHGHVARLQQRRRGLLARLPGLRRRHPHAREVIVDAGRNDSEESELAVALAARSYLDAVRAGWPTATVTVLLPTLREARQPAGYQRISGLLREICAGRPGVRVVDPGADAEFVRACESPGRLSLVCPDGFHPSHQGQGLYARVLTRLLA